MNIGNISVMIEINDKPHFVFIKKEDESLIIDLISQLSENNKMRVIEAPKGYIFKPLGEIFENT